MGGVEIASVTQFHLASNAITLCLMSCSYTKDHLQYRGVFSSTFVPAPALNLLNTVANDVFNKTSNLSRVLRVAAINSVMLFPPLLRLLPHVKGACSSKVRTGVKHHLSLWGLTVTYALLQC